MQSEAAKKAGTLQKGQNPGKAEFISFQYEMKGFSSSGAMQKAKISASALLCEEQRVHTCFITMSCLLPSNHWSEGSAAVSSSSLFLLSLFLFFFLLTKRCEMPSLDMKGRNI